MRNDAAPAKSPVTQKTGAAAYGIFLWQLMKSREALTSLSVQTFAAKERDPIEYAANGDPNKLVLGLLASAGRTLRNEILQSIRNSCAGAILQIAWTLFDAHLELLGFTREERRNVHGGMAFAGGEPFSRVLWAARNAFAHGFDWATTGPSSAAGRISVSILQREGFAAPSHAGVYDYFMLLSDGNIETFLRRLEGAAKDVSEAREAAADPSATGATPALLGLVVGLAAVLIAYFSAERSAQEIDDKLIIAFQLRHGPAARVVAIASGEMHSPMRIQAIMEEQAIAALSSEAAQPFKEAEARFTAWTAQAQVLLTTDVGTDRFYRDLLDLTDRMEEIYAMTLALPSPLTQLLEERGADSLEEMHAVLSEVLSAHPDFESMPFRVVETDISASNDGSKK